MPITIASHKLRFCLSRRPYFGKLYPFTTDALLPNMGSIIVARRDEHTPYKLSAINS